MAWGDNDLIKCLCRATLSWGGTGVMVKGSWLFNQVLARGVPGNTRHPCNDGSYSQRDLVTSSHPASWIHPGLDEAPSVARKVVLM